MAKLENTSTPSTQKAVSRKASTASKQQAVAQAPSKRQNAGSNASKHAQWLQNAFYAIWSVVGLIVIGLFLAALVGVGSLSLGDSDAIEPQQQPPETAQPQQPPQPTQEQLDCVREQVGDERFAELEQGEFADDEESAIIQECLQ